MIDEATAQVLALTDEHGATLPFCYRTPRETSAPGAHVGQYPGGELSMAVLVSASTWLAVRDIGLVTVTYPKRLTLRGHAVLAEFRQAHPGWRP